MRYETSKFRYSFVVLLVAIMGSVLPCGLCSAGQPDSIKDAQKIDQRVNVLVDAKKYSEALPVAEKAANMWGTLKGQTAAETTRSKSQLAEILDHLGSRCSDLCQYEKAIGYYEQALAICREIKDSQGEGKSLRGLGNCFFRVSQYEKAIGYYEEVLAVYRVIKNKAGEGHALRGLGNCYMYLSQYDKAIRYHEQAIAISKEVKDTSGEGTALNSLGSSYYYLSQYRKAISCHEQALVISRRIKDGQGEGNALNSLGICYDSISQYYKAVGYYEQALVIFRRIGYRNGEGSAASNLGNCYYSLGQYEKAIRYQGQALEIGREIKDRNLEENVLGSLGNCWQSLSQYEKATGYHEQALAISREIKDRDGEAADLGSLGNCYSSLSRYEKAMWYLEQALAINRENMNKSGEATTSGNLGNCCYSLGLYERAIGYYERALAVLKEIEDRRGEAATTHNLGLCYWSLDQYEKAIKWHEQALVIAREIKDISGEADCLGSLGSCYSDLRQYGKAIGYHNQALEIYRKIKDRQKEGADLNNLGSTYRNLGQYEKATDCHGQSLAIAREIKYGDGEGYALLGLMLDWNKRGYPALAIAYGKQAVNVKQSIRSSIAGLDKEIQRSYLGANENTYRVLADILAEQGRIPEAQQVLNMLKEEDYFEFVRGDRSQTGVLGKVFLTNKEQDWIKRYDEVGNRLTVLGVEKQALESKKRLSKEEQSRLNSLYEAVPAATKAFLAFLDVIKDESISALQEGAKFAEIGDSQTLRNALKEISGGCVAVHTLVGEKRTWLILTTPDVQLAREVKISRGDLNTKIVEFKNTLQDRTLDPRPLARDLYDLLIGPITQDLDEAQAKTIAWSLDGTLRYIPIAALWDGNGYAVQKYRNVVYTPASDKWLVAQPNPKWKALGLGVAKKRTVRNKPYFALGGVIDELGGIVKKGVGAGLMPGKILLNEAFTFASMQRSLRGREYPLVHIASHFILDPDDFTKSFLLTWDKNPPTLADIKADGDFSGVDLLTLSACDTNVVSKGADGREVDGLAMTVQKEGARSVIASLWPVDDESTPLLMMEFYRLRESIYGLSKAEALQEAQLRLLTGQTQRTSGEAIRGTRRAANLGSKPSDTLEFKPDPKAPFAHPYYWAPFVMIGNWR